MKEKHKKLLSPPHPKQLKNPPQAPRNHASVVEPT